MVIKNQLKSKDMKITVDEHLSLELLSSKHTKELFQLIDNNRTYLRNWLPLVEQHTLKILQTIYLWVLL